MATSGGQTAGVSGPQPPAIVRCGRKGVRDLPRQVFATLTYREGKMGKKSFRARALPNKVADVLNEATGSTRFSKVPGICSRQMPADMPWALLWDFAFPIEPGTPRGITYKAGRRDSKRVLERLRKDRLRRAGRGVTPVELRRQRVLQDDCCFWCDSLLHGKGQLDHIIPIAKGGANEAFNAVLACAKCNRRKSARLPLEWKAIRVA